jgi:hypothetical protein
MFGAGTILARSATPAPNMGVATEGSGAAKCVLYAVFAQFEERNDLYLSPDLYKL